MVRALPGDGAGYGFAATGVRGSGAVPAGDAPGFSCGGAGAGGAAAGAAFPAAGGDGGCGAGGAFSAPGAAALCVDRREWQAGCGDGGKGGECREYRGGAFGEGAVGAAEGGCCGVL